MVLTGLILAYSSCSVDRRGFSNTLPDGYYRLKEGDSTKRVQVYNNEDTSYLLFDMTSPPTSVGDYLRQGEEQIFIRRSLDLEVFSTPVKLRPPQKIVPRQLNSHINGNFYVGYRTDHYLFGKRAPAPGLVQRYCHRVGYGGGAFVGVGSVFMNPTFLQNAIPYEYDGLVFSYGVAGLVGYRKISTGLCLGMDYLTDRYRNRWIYQNKPWLGLIIAINVN